MKILIVEDSDSKFVELDALISSISEGSVFSRRATTVTDAEAMIESEEWSAIVLDISMDITKSATGVRLGGHATLGGLSIATKMYLLGREVPTIIVTAFDSFQAVETERPGYEALGLEDIERRATEILGEAYLGCVRYGDPGWEARLLRYLKDVML
jgi:hypothetical protein